LPEPMETDARAAAVMAETLARQAAGLHRLFMRTFADVLSNKDRSLRDVSRALKAQNQCRIVLRLMLALRALEQAQKKSRNRTNRLLRGENLHHDQILAKASPEARLWSTKAPPQTVGMVSRTTCSTGGVAPVLATVDKVDRSANPLGQSPLRRECAQTRLQKPGLYRREARRAAACPRLRPNNRPGQNAPPHPVSHQRTLNPTSPNAGRSIRRSAFARSRIGWGEPLQRSRTFARSPPRCLEPSRCMRLKPWHRLGSRAILAAKYVKYGGETCAHSNT